MNRWLNFYNSIKDSSWPVCVTEYEFNFLPKEIKEEIINVFNGSSYLTLNDDDIEIFNEGQGYSEILENSQPNNIKKFAVAKDFNVLYDEIGRAHV